MRIEKWMRRKKIVIDEMSEGAQWSLCCGPISSCEWIKTFNPPHHRHDSVAHLLLLPEFHKDVGGRHDRGDSRQTGRMTITILPPLLSREQWIERWWMSHQGRDHSLVLLWSLCPLVTNNEGPRSLGRQGGSGGGHGGVWRRFTF